MADKNYILIAIEPCGEFCNPEGKSGCPLKRAEVVEVEGEREFWYVCRIFGPLQAVMSSDRIAVPRHEGCVEAQASADKHFREKK